MNFKKAFEQIKQAFEETGVSGSIAEFERGQVTVKDRGWRKAKPGEKPETEWQKRLGVAPSKVPYEQSQFPGRPPVLVVFGEADAGTFQGFNDPLPRRKVRIFFEPVKFK